MKLTPDLVALVQREIADPGLPEGWVPLDEADYDRIVADLVADAAKMGNEGAGDRQAGHWVFACGSLIWKPEFEPAETRVGHLHGYHRRFCIRIVHFRGTPEGPGLMMALDRGGSCRGLLQRIPPGALEESLHKLLRREMMLKSSANAARWVMVQTEAGALPALAPVIDRRAVNYAGRVDLETTADFLAGAAGHWGSCAEYLMNTVQHLRAAGLHDAYLWRLQEMVAARIEAAAGRTDP